MTYKQENGYYVLTSTVVYDLDDIDLGYFKFYTLKGLLIAESQGNKLILYPGYAWNGCTVIGAIIETKNTLKASALHDFLYQVGNHHLMHSRYTRWYADMAFLSLIHWSAHLLYGVGLISFGGFFFGDGDKLIVK